MSKRLAARLLWQAGRRWSWQPAPTALPNAAQGAWASYSSDADAPSTATARSADAAAIAKQAQLYSRSFTSPTRSLEYARGEVQYPTFLEGNVLGRGVLTLIGAYGRKQQLYNGAAVLYGAITEQAEDDDLQKAVGLEPGTFMTCYSLLSLHMWLIINRLKVESRADAATFQQLLYTELFYKDVERRIYKAGVTVHVGKWQRKLEQLFYGSSLAYDRGLAGQGVDFEDALIKNVYGGDPAHKPSAALLERYLSRQLQNLMLTDTAAIYKGQVKFDLDIQR